MKKRVQFGPWAFGGVLYGGPNKARGLLGKCLDPVKEETTCVFLWAARDVQWNMQRFRRICRLVIRSMSWITLVIVSVVFQVLTPHYSFQPWFILQNKKC